MTETSYRAHAMARAAVERKFEIIGEALNQLSRVDGVLAARVPDLRVIVDFRNALIHGYAVIDDGRVWRIVEKHVPDDRRELSAEAAWRQAEAGIGVEGAGEHTVDPWVGGRSPTARAPSL